MIDELIHTSTLLMDLAPSINSTSLIIDNTSRVLIFPFILFIFRFAMYSFIIYGLVMQGLNGIILRKQSIKLLIFTNIINLIMTVIAFVIVVLYPKKSRKENNN